LGPIFRRGGAFFIRRSFGGDKIYSAVCAAYVKRLLKEGFAVEFFIEGGRSRTGKLLPPKMGMLSMCVDPVLDGALPDVSFVPVSMSYDKIIEARSYARELEGGEKKKEDVGALLSSRSVLRSKYGRAYVDFDEPISLRAFAAARGFATDQSTESPGARRNLVAQLGHRILYGIHHVTRVTPTGAAALVLLSQTRPGMSETELERRAERMIEMLFALGARLSSSLEAPTRRDAIREALGRLAADGLVAMLPSPDGETIYRVEEEGRRALDYYKNNNLHFLGPHAILALAGLIGGDLEATAQRLSQILKHDLSYKVEGGFGANFRAAGEALVGRRVLERTSEGSFVLVEAAREQAIELAGLIAVFLEAYRVVAQELRATSGAIPERQLEKNLLGRARRRVMEGTVRRAEAASPNTLHNGVRLMLDLTIAKRVDNGLVVEDQGRADAIIEELGRYLEALELSV
jgi:glycerol-3-phosphate O-acyltransferase